MGLPGKSTVKGLRCEAPTRGGAPLTVILNGKSIVGTVGRVTRTDRLARRRRPRNGEQPLAQGSGADCPAPARCARQRPRARGRGPCRRPRRGQCPAHSPAEALTLVV